MTVRDETATLAGLLLSFTRIDKRDGMATIPKAIGRAPPRMTRGPVCSREENAEECDVE